MITFNTKKKKKKKIYTMYIFRLNDHLYLNRILIELYYISYLNDH